MSRGLTCGIIAVVLAWTTSISAHHPLSVYRQDQRLELTGRLVEFVARNPHSLLHCDVPSAAGGSERWVVEWISALQLRRQGIAPQTLKIGDQLVLSGYPSRVAGDRRLWLRTIRRPADGWSWTGGF